MSNNNEMQAQDCQKQTNHPFQNQNHEEKLNIESNISILKKGQPSKIPQNIQPLHQKLSIKPQKNYLKVVNQIIEAEKTQCIKDRKIQLASKEVLNKQSIPSNPCQCQGNTECKKKLIFLEDQLRKMSGAKSLKPIIAIYNIEKIIGHVQFYMVEYFDHSLQKLSGAQLRKNYLKEYVRFLEEQCFDS